MKYWTECDFSDISYTTSRSGFNEYINLECALDIETTSTYVNYNKVAFMYVWMVGIGHNKTVYYGRTWDELLDFLDMVKTHFKLSVKRRMVVYIHNLSFEFQFMRHHFNWVDSFNLKERKPLRVISDIGIEFRDSYILTDATLETTANNLIHHNISKLTGNLDYSLIRHHETPLTDEELAYCENDIIILTAYISEQLHIYNGSIAKIPMTNTSRVRRFVKDSVHYTNQDYKSKFDSRYVKYREFISSLTLEPDEYFKLKKAFQGGFVHASPLWVDNVMEDVTSIDFVSSYPSVMLAEQFPMSEGKKIDVCTLDAVRELMKDYCVLFTINFTRLESKIQQEHYLSESKCVDVINPIVFDGRIASADSLSTTITDVDLNIIDKVYDYESVSVSDVIIYGRDYLPKNFIKAILELYEKKTTLKGVVGMEAEYSLSKRMLNSAYGMTVTNIVREEVEYKNGWVTKYPLAKEQIKGYNESKGRFLHYPWGVWVTAYARRNLWSGILAFNDDYLYSDTDGIKVINFEEHKGYVSAYNRHNRRKLERMCDYYNIDSNRLSPKNRDGYRVHIGDWAFDGHYDRFKTLGAKRYLTQKGGDVSITVAGVGKSSARDYLLQLAEGDIHEVFELFNNQLVIPSEHSGNITHTYIDNEMEFEIEDYTGDTAMVHCKSGLHLQSVDFSFSWIDTLFALTDYYEYDNMIYTGADTYSVY